jgi:Hemerythrin HHE cation binding domain
MTATPPTNPGWRVQLAIHRAVRRDVSRLSTAMERKPLPAAEVRPYWSVTAAQLHHHHEFEDTVVWPLMGERLGDRVEELLTRNTSEHRVMAEAMERFDAAIGNVTIDAAEARAALGLMDTAVETHLVHEEADVLPLIPEAFTMDDIAFFQAEDAKSNAADVFLPWMLDDAAEADVSFFTRSMPPPVRHNLEAAWMPRWLETVDALGRGASVASIP